MSKLITINKDELRSLIKEIMVEIFEERKGLSSGSKVKEDKKFDVHLDKVFSEYEDVFKALA